MSTLEDEFHDILGKVLRARGWNAAHASKLSGLPAPRIEALLKGGFDEDDTRKLAGALGLQADALVAIARRAYCPEVSPPSNLAVITTDFQDMKVNAYIVWDADKREAAIFDTGADAAPILATVKENDLGVIAIFLTHGHADHIHALAELKHALGVDAWSSEFEPVHGTRTFRPGDFFNVGRHFIRTRHTPGHTPGGATFLIEGHNVQAAIVGDALFAGSIGGVSGNYDETLDLIRSEILSLPDRTILCPGHGALTTVELEKANNPFFA